MELGIRLDVMECKNHTELLQYPNILSLLHLKHNAILMVPVPKFFRPKFYFIKILRFQPFFKV